MESHCQGTTPATMFGAAKLTEEYGYSHFLSNVEHRGALQLMNIHYQQHHYDDSDFRLYLRVRPILTS